MRNKTKIALFVALMALSACTSNRFGRNGADGAFGANGLNGGVGAGAGAYAQGGVSDPRSPEYFQQTVGDRVLFAVDQSTLSGEARQILTAQARWLLDNPAYSAIIEGHADEQGTREYNLALGARRASSAREFLVSQGIAGNRLRTVSYGKERPLAVCSDESCYAKNRRAVTVIAAGAGA
ncbi:MAG: peptidoglycan-associated lipoprotein Pal [Sagittula sp.]|uniref:peptidoglycan-associated lipoprotein Pal n=1 Tax=Sagittula sp. TaxID=2038081 RepID=UPI00405936E4